MILVTHDLGVVATRTDEIIVMYAGNVVERAPTNVLFKSMAMPYTEALLKSTPRIANPSHTRLPAIEGRPPDLLNPPAGLPLRPPLPLRPGQVPRGEASPGGGRRPGHSYACWFPLTATDRPAPPPQPDRCRRDRHPWSAGGRDRAAPVRRGSPRLLPQGHATVQAVAGISFTMRQGETLGLVGESGCGKSTTGRAIVQVEKATSGKIPFGDTELTALSRGDLRTLRTQVQMIFQDPISSLNPRRRVDRHRGRAARHLEDRHQGGAPARRPTPCSTGRHRPLPSTAPAAPASSPGGQCQRISIARALVLKPKLLVCDEIVSALDVSVQAQILNLLEDLKQEYDLTILFIAHDLAVVKNVSDRVAVMYLGRLCEIAPSDLLYEAPAHHYTAALLASAVEPDPEAARTPVALTGEPPSPINPPSGCRFRTRCPRAEARCAEEVPEMREIAPGHQVACHFPIGS